MKTKLLLLTALFTIACSYLCQAQSDVLWGTGEFGGEYNSGNSGVILNYNVTTSTESDVYNFGNNANDAQDPQSNLIEASNGLLYGVTSNGAYSGGTIFSYDRYTGVETVLHNFGKDTFAFSGLVQVNDSMLYGTTNNGGIYGEGTIFSYNIKSGIETYVHNFGSGSDGAYPSGTLMLASDGLLYGLTSLRGVYYAGGTLYKFNFKTGVESTVYNFGSGKDGAQPSGTLLQATNGLLYGITQTGGTHVKGGDLGGIIFSCDTLGTEIDLHNFDSTDGQNPYEGLIQVNDSMFYGMAHYGGTANTGVFYSFNISSDSEIVLQNFTGTNGADPRGRLLLASNGLIYGMTTDGGTNEAGTIFNYNISSATLTVIHNFPFLSPADGAYPTGGFIEIDSSAFQVVPTTSTFCSGDSVELIASGATTYTWTPSTGLSATTGDSVIAKPTVTTTYTITANGVGTTTVTITVNPSPVITVNAPPAICDGNSAALTASGGVTYVWSPSTGLSATTGSSVTADPTTSTTYFLTGTNSNGCSASDTIEIRVTIPPNKPTITRNGDTLNSSATTNNQWMVNDTAIDGATNPTYVITQSGCYSVSVINPANGCSSTSDTSCITPTGINPLSIDKNQLTIYPNPTSGVIFVNISSSVEQVTDWNLKITDVLGRPVYTMPSMNYKNAIDLSNLPGGLYFITITDKLNRLVVPVELGM